MPCRAATHGSGHRRLLKNEFFNNLVRFDGRDLMCGAEQAKSGGFEYTAI